MKKYAVCIWGQLRAIPPTIKNLYKYVIDLLQADVYIVVQKTHTDIDKDIELFKTPHKIIYEPLKNIQTKFKIYDKLIIKNNYLLDQYLQVYYNWYKIYKLFGDQLEKYEAIIITRSDFLHLFPYPDILKLYPLNDTVWCYEGHEYKGINVTCICIPSKYIKTYLTASFNYLQKSKNINRLNLLNLNTEAFQKLIFDDYNWKIGKLQNNAFITGTNINEISTTPYRIKYHPKYKVYYKYDHQLNNTMNALHNFKNWKLQLSKPYNKIVVTSNTRKNINKRSKTFKVHRL